MVDAYVDASIKGGEAGVGILLKKDTTQCQAISLADKCNEVGKL